MSSSELAGSYLRREAPSHALPTSRAGSHLLVQLRYVTGTTDCQVAAQFYPLLSTNSKHLGPVPLSGTNAATLTQCPVTLKQHFPTLIPGSWTGSSSLYLIPASRKSPKNPQNYMQSDKNNTIATNHTHMLKIRFFFLF